MEAMLAAMRPLGIWWAVAGGWAIDLWIGEQTRAHHDLEVVVRRADRARVWESLHDEPPTATSGSSDGTAASAGRSPMS